MNKKALITVVSLLAAIIGLVSICPAKINTDPQQQLPDPDGKPATMDRPVRVFILLGQSNMLGFGKVTPADKNGTLTYAITTKHKYHYNHNAETYMDVGNALGWAMADLLLNQHDSTPEKTTTSVQALQDQFRKLKFGMFIHYNMATYQGVQWTTGYPSPAEFNPGGTVDTDAWADAAVSAGMTYGVLTAKHVGGFCLWDSQYTTYDVMHPDCPYHQDLVAQFIRSFKRRGLKVGLYYCWRHPGFDASEKRKTVQYKVLPPECDPATHTLKQQIEFEKQQIAELIEKYPDVFYIWNDALDDQIMPAEEARAFFRGLGRDVLASSNWWDWGKKGTPYLDIAIKEVRDFPETNQAPGETCWKLEQGWFWNQGARPTSAQAIMDHMARAHRRNSNFLLNTGPDRQGKIMESSVKTLAEIGRLLDQPPR